MAEQRYIKPELPEGVKVHQLVPEHGVGTVLGPETPVLVLNRYNRTIVDKFDSVDYPIPPGITEMPYAAALHFKARAVVPGSRNPETGRQESFLGIIGIDRPERCEPFTPEQCQAFGLRVEALAREEMIDPNARQAQPIATRDVQRRLLSGQGRKVQLPTMAEMQAKGAGAEQTAAVLQQPEGTAADEEAAEAAAEGAAEEPAAPSRVRRR